MASTAIALTGAFSACTLSEPNNGDSESVRLISILSSSMTLYDIQYDSQGRPVQINDREYDARYIISYAPFELVIEEGAPKDAMDADSDEMYMEYRTVISDGTFNTAGYLTGATITETEYDVDGNVISQESSPLVLRYDNFGHLISYIDDGEVVFSYDWDINGNLTSYTTDSGTVTIKYGTTPNPKRQWTPFWDNIGPFRLTGLFGVAPAYMPASWVEDNGMADDGSYISRKWAYQLTDAGWIQAVQEVVEGYSQVFNFRYSK